MTNNILRFMNTAGADDPIDLLFDAAPVMMHSIDATGTLIRVSRFWAAKLGYEVEEMVGRKSVEFLTETSQEYARSSVMPEFFETGKIFNVEYDFVRKDGRTLPVLMSAVAQNFEDGVFQNSLAVIFDNTEAKRTQKELLLRQRTEAIGELVGGVAHDFNNFLAVIQGNLEFLREDPDDPDRNEFIDSALKATQRGAVLTKQLLTYSRKAHLDPKLTKLSDIVASTGRLLKRLLPANIQIETVNGADLWPTEVDVVLLETAILNIVNNARDAMLNGGRITIETRNTRIDEDYIAARNEEITPGRYVMLAVSDTGGGIAAEDLDKIYEPFFTTKAVGEGSGLGLSMVIGFMRQSNGTIRTYSEPGVGTTFKLYFPAHVTEPEVIEKAAAQETAYDPGRVVLLAEDDEHMRRVLVRQLVKQNLTVVECATGDDALRRIEAGLRPAVVLTDIVMPGTVQGPELVQRARAIIGDLRVLFISGYPAEAAIHGNGVQRQDVHLVKPVSTSELISAINKLLADDP